MSRPEETLGKRIFAEPIGERLKRAPEGIDMVRVGETIFLYPKLGFQVQAQAGNGERQPATSSPRCRLSIVKLPELHLRVQTAIPRPIVG